MPVLINRRAALLAATSISLIAAANAARADEPSRPADASAPSTTTSGQSWVSEVLVTGAPQGYAAPTAASATRTDTPLIQVPQSVQVLTRTLIQEQDRRTLADALVNVSGVTPTKSEEILFTSPLVRGFASEIYVDGLPLFGQTQAANDPDSLVGVERIEVLKGPSSTLYGGGLGSPLGGLINIASTRPTDTFGGYVALRGGSFSTFNPYGEVNLPLASGVNARIAAEYQSNESWVDQLKGKRWSVQPSLSIALDPRTDLFLQLQASHRDQLEYSGLPAVQALAGGLDRNAFPGAPVGQPRTAIDKRLATVELRHAFSDDLRLTLSGRYYKSHNPEYGTFVYPDLGGPDPATPTVYPIFALNMLSKAAEGALDANLMAKADLLGGRHTLLFGASYDHTDFYSNMGFAGVPLGAIDLADPRYTLAFGGEVPASLTQTDTYETIAGYVQDQADYGRLHLTGSLRYTRLEFHEREQTTDASYNHVSPRIGATFDLAPGVALYAGYATAFKAPFGFIGMKTPKPETSTNYEGGVKFALKDIGLSGTLAAFQQTRNNVATADPENLFMSVQTGQQRARGVEADFVWEPIPAFSLLANYAHTQAKVTRDNTIPVGDVLPRVPKNSGRIAARYRVLDGRAQGLSFGAGVTAFGARQTTLPNAVWVPGYAAIDAQAAYDIGRFTIQVSTVNLGGRKAYDTFQYFSFPVVMPPQPRSANVTLKARF
ncbi:TonB-dependent siderophore receptor [Caulobacter sp. SSI4214]|uniref:TonB-dependent siderophore receptor n=1 Tax=Caulobacter sp. SSI4214 TaxID=2575739 RepID=UPI0014390B38|nr:TonB-dependent siderophore receptor [Caulobacter sp. SSI4214]